jgi:hypothetical protein
MASIVDISHAHATSSYAFRSQRPVGADRTSTGLTKGAEVELQAALLCSAASVRDGLLSVIDAGRTQIAGVEFPLALDLTLALMVNCDASEVRASHAVRVAVVASDTEVQVGGMQQCFSPVPQEVSTDINFPLVLDLSPLALPARGDYEVRVFLDDVWRALLPITASLGG